MQINRSVLVFVAAIASYIGCVALQPADLGTFGSQNDLQGGPAYSLPANSRLPNEVHVLAYINYTYVNEEGKVIVSSRENARYGEGLVKTVEGKVVHVTSEKDGGDHTACHENIAGTNGGELPPSGEPWIALIRRGRCLFEDKVKNAYNKHAIGVIVYDEHESIKLDKIKIEDKGRKWSTFITLAFAYQLSVTQQGALYLHADLTRFKGSESRRW